MYHNETNTPALARTSNLNEELGQVICYHIFFFLTEKQLFLMNDDSFSPNFIWDRIIFSWHSYGAHGLLNGVLLANIQRD